MEKLVRDTGELLDGLGSAMVGRSNVPLLERDVGRDGGVFVVFSVFFFVFSWALRLILVEPTARHAFQMERVQVVKLAQSVTEVLFYCGFTVVGAMVVPVQPWAWPSILWWDGFSRGEHVLMRIDLRCYYVAYSARYAQMVVSVLLEPKRKDFKEMVLHHVLTVVVIYVSYMAGFTRVGVIVMFLLDPADVPLHLAKICKYLADATQSGMWQFMANRLFEAFAVVFFVSRILLFSYVVWSATIEAPKYIPVSSQDAPPGITCAIILWVLLGLQGYWFWLILKVAVKLVSSGAVEDVRSDDEGDGKRERPKPISTPRTPRRWHWPVAPALTGVAMVFFLGLQSVRAEVALLLAGCATTLARSAAASAALPVGAPQLRRDALVCAVFTLALFAFNWGLRLLGVEPLARAKLRLRGPKMVKFAQSCMEAVFYGSFTVIGLLIVPSQPWVWPSSLWWSGFVDGGHEVMRSDLRCYYLLYIARYVQAVGSVLLEPKRKDFVVMLAHHIVTVVVCSISYTYGWNRVGVVVMVLLDPADVPLHLAKLCKYVSGANGRTMWHYVADRLFEVFAVVFFCTRLVMYSYVCWSAYLESRRYLVLGTPGWTCVAGLFMLLALQIYWFCLIVKVAVNLIRGSGLNDPRSDEETSNPVATEGAERKKRQ